MLFFFALLPPLLPEMGFGGPGVSDCKASSALARQVAVCYGCGWGRRPRLPLPYFPPWAESNDRAAPPFRGALPARFASLRTVTGSVAYFPFPFRGGSAVSPLLDLPFLPVSPFGLYP